MSGLPNYTLEAQFGVFFGQPIWYDITPYLELTYGQLTIARGRQDEQSTPQVGQLAATLANPDGRFTPGNSASPYYPYVLDGAPVRCTARIRTKGYKNHEDNGSHENGIAEWTGGGTGTAPALTQSTTHIHADGGTWAMLITWANNAVDSLAQRTIYGLTIGQQYTWSRYVWVPSGSPDVRLQAGGNGLVTTAGSYTSTKNAEARISVTFTATWTSHVLQVQVASSVGGGQCWTDAGQGELGGSATSLDPPPTLLQRFYGQALEWPAAWQGPQATFMLTQLVAQDVTARLGQRNGALRSFDVEEALLDSPVTLLPLDEPQGATQAGNLGGWAASAVPVNVGGAGTYTFAAGTGPPADGVSSLILTPASSTSGWYLRAATFFYAASAATLECFINSATASTTLVDVSGSAYGSVGGNGLTLSVDGAKKLKFTSDFGALVVISPAIVADGATHHVAVTYVHSGSQHTAALYVDGVNVTSGSISSTAVGFSGQYLLVGGGAKNPLFNGTINHVGAYPSALSAARLAAHYHAGWDGFGGERSDARISRLAAYTGLSSLTPGNRTGVGIWDDAVLGLWDSTFVWAASDLNLEVGSAYVYGQSGGGSDPLSAMTEVAVTEGGLVLADRYGFLDFQARAHRYNAAAKASVPAEYLTTDFAPDWDNQLVTNDVTMTTQDSASQRYVDTASVGQRGTYDGSASLLTRDVGDAYQAAAWKVTRRGAPQLKYPTAVVDLATIPNGTVAAVLAVDVGDRLDVTGLPSQVPASTAQLFVEGYTETVTADSATVSFNTSNAAGWAVGVWNSPAFGLWDQTLIWAW